VSGGRFSPNALAAEKAATAAWHYLSQQLDLSPAQCAALSALHEDAQRLQHRQTALRDALSHLASSARAHVGAADLFISDIETSVMPRAEQRARWIAWIKSHRQSVDACLARASTVAASHPRPGSGGSPFTAGTATPPPALDTVISDSGVGSGVGALDLMRAHSGNAVLMQQLQLQHQQLMHLHHPTRHSSGSFPVLSASPLSHLNATEGSVHVGSGPGPGGSPVLGANALAVDDEDDPFANELESAHLHHGS
jgi:hypothetical protein